MTIGQYAIAVWAVFGLPIVAYFGRRWQRHVVCGRCRLPTRKCVCGEHFDAGDEYNVKSNIELPVDEDRTSN